MMDPKNGSNVDISSAVLPDDSDNGVTSQSFFSRIISRFGPACLVCVAALDPGNLEVDVQAGSIFGYRLMWVLLYSSIAGWLLQTISAHLAILTRSHLAELCAIEYSDAPFVSASLFIVAEISILSFDVAEVIGTAFALQLLFAWPLWFGCIVSAVDTLIILYFQKNGLTKVELAIEGMLVILSASLMYEFCISRPDVSAIVEGAVVPTLGVHPRESSLLAIGILGSLVMSHNLFLHSWLVKLRNDNTEQHSSLSTDVENFVQRNDVGGMDVKMDVKKTCRDATIETGVIFVGTLVVNIAVVAISAAQFYPHRNEKAFQDIGLKEASVLLENVLGTKFASFAWAIALLCSGHAATVTGTLASQTVLEGFLRIKDLGSSRVASFATRAIAIVPAVSTALYAGDKGADRLIVMSQIVLSFALPFAVIPMIRFMRSARRSHMLENEWLVVTGCAAFLFVALANVVATFASIQEELNIRTMHNGAYALLALIAVCYSYVLVFLLRRPLRLGNVIHWEELSPLCDTGRCIGSRC